MHLGRFHAVIADLASHFRVAELAARLEKVATALEAVASSRTDANVEAFRTTLSDLMEATEAKDPDLFQPYAIDVIQQIGLSSMLSPPLRNHIDELIDKRGFDAAGLASDLRELSKKILSKVKAVLAVDSAFTSLDVELERVIDTEAEVGLLLPKEVVGNSLNLLTSEFGKIGLLARAINEITGAPDYDPKVRTISSSWWQIFLELDAAQVAAWTFAIERIVALFKSNLEIKKLQQDLSERKMPEAIVDAVQQEIDRRLKGGIEDIASAIRSQHSSIDDQARLNELENQLRQGLFYLARRMSQGSQIEVNVGIPKAPDEPEAIEGSAPNPLMLREMQDQRNRIAELRQLRQRARSASVSTLESDPAAPLLLPDASDSNDEAR